MSIPVTGIPARSRLAQFAYNFPNWSNTTPFTYQDGVTNAKLVESIIVYIDQTLVPYIDTEIALLFAEWKTNVEEILSGVDKAIDDIVTLSETLATNVNARLSANEASVSERLTLNEASVSERLTLNEASVSERLTLNEASVSERLALNETRVNNVLEEVVENSIELQDIVMSGIVSTPDSDTRSSLNDFFNESALNMHANARAIALKYMEISSR